MNLLKGQRSPKVGNTPKTLVSDHAEAQALPLPTATPGASVNNKLPVVHMKTASSRSLGQLLGSGLNASKKIIPSAKAMASEVADKGKKNISSFKKGFEESVNKKENQDTLRSKLLKNKKTNLGANKARDDYFSPIQSKASPQKEPSFINKNKENMALGGAIGAGASFGYMAGREKKAFFCGFDKQSNLFTAASNLIGKGGVAIAKAGKGMAETSPTISKGIQNAGGFIAKNRKPLTAGIGAAGVGYGAAKLTSDNKSPGISQ